MTSAFRAADLRSGGPGVHPDRREHLGRQVGEWSIGGAERARDGGEAGKSPPRSWMGALVSRFFAFFRRALARVDQRRGPGGRGAAIFFLTVLVLLLAACDEPVSPASRAATPADAVIWVHDSDTLYRLIIKEFELRDGTRCVAMIGAGRGGLSCDWRSGLGARP